MEPATMAGYAALVSGMSLINRLADHFLGPPKQMLMAHEQRERHHAEDMEFRRSAAKASEERTAAQVINQAHLAHQTSRYNDIVATWPLKLRPNIYNDLAKHVRVQPLVMAFRPPEMTDLALASELGKQGEHWIEKALNYANHVLDPERPVHFLSGDPWRQDAPRAQTAIDLLYGGAPNVPTAVIELVKIGDNLHIKTACYGFGLSGTSLPPAIHSSETVNFRAATVEIARGRAEQIRDSATIRDLDSSSLRSLDNENVNIDILNLEERLGLPLSDYFSTNPSQMIKALRIVGPALQIIALGLADFFHFSRHGAMPVLPRLLPEVIASFPEALNSELSSQVLADYERTYSAFASHQQSEPYRLAELASGFAAAGLPVHEAARRVLDKAIKRFLTLRGASPNQTLPGYLATATQAADRAFLIAIAQTYQALGDTDMHRQVLSAAAGLRISSTADTKQLTSVISKDRHQKLLEQYAEIFATYEPVAKVNNS